MPDDAQRRADQVAAFRAELAELQRTGVLRLSDEALGAVARHHEELLDDLARRGADVGERGKHVSLAMRMASLIAALALGASVFYFFFSVWGAIAFPIQVALLTAAPILALTGTAVAASRERSGAVTAILGALAVACFILDVVALGGALDLPGSPWSFLLWSGFALVVAYAYELRLALAAGVVCLAVFLAGALHHVAGGAWMLFLQRPECLLLPGGLALLIPLLRAEREPSGFGTIWRVAAVVLLFVPCLILSGTGASYLPIEESDAAVGYQVAGFLGSAGLVWLGLARLRKDLIYSSTLAFVALLFQRFVEWWWDWLPRYLFFLVVAAGALLALWVLRRLHVAVSARTEAAR
jgi:hypothetical protein